MTKTTVFLCKKCYCIAMMFKVIEPKPIKEFPTKVGWAPVQRLGFCEQCKKPTVIHEFPIRR